MARRGVGVEAEAWGSRRGWAQWARQVEGVLLAGEYPDATWLMRVGAIPTLAVIPGEDPGSIQRRFWEVRAGKTRLHGSSLSRG